MLSNNSRIFCGCEGYLYRVHAAKFEVVDSPSTTSLQSCAPSWSAHINQAETSKKPRAMLLLAKAAATAC